MRFFKYFFVFFEFVFALLKYLLVPMAVAAALFAILCGVWYFVFRFKGLELPPSGTVRVKKKGMLWQIFFEVPRRYMLDIFSREPGYFCPRGIHIFCGEQGCGKTIGAVEMMLRLKKMYPAAKMTSNFGLSNEDAPLDRWQMLLDYTNGHQGVIVGIDEIQNWFMSGSNKLPVEMLEIVTQNRKNNRVLVCTAQVFTRVNKGIREQVSLVYNPHTFLGCFTVVIKRKPVFDSEGNVLKLKYMGMYSFVHTDELRAAYDTYKVIHTLAEEGFNERAYAKESVLSSYFPAEKNER